MYSVLKKKQNTFVIFVRTVIDIPSMLYIYMLLTTQICSMNILGIVTKIDFVKNGCFVHFTALFQFLRFAVANNKNAYTSSSKSEGM